MWKRTLLHDIRSSIKFLDDVGADNVGLLVDTYHWYTGGCTYEDIENLGKDRMFAIHLNDAPNLPVQELYDGLRVLPGEGVIDIKGFLRTVKKTGYDSFVAVEVLGPNQQEFVGLGPKAGAAKMKKLLENLLASI